MSCKCQSKQKNKFQLLSDFCVWLHVPLTIQSLYSLQRTNKHIPMDLRGAKEAKSRYFPLRLDSNVLLFRNKEVLSTTPLSWEITWWKPTSKSKDQLFTTNKAFGSESVYGQCQYKYPSTSWRIKPGPQNLLNYNFQLSNNNTPKISV